MEIISMSALAGNTSPLLLGRRMIYTNRRIITPANVINELGNALAVHAMNAGEIDYLYDVYRGKQNVLNKEKITRPEINNKVLVNEANAIVTFKTASLLAGPIQYVSAGNDGNLSDRIYRLNEYMRAEDKETKDKELADWMHICGVGAKIVLPDSAAVEDGSPVDFYTLDPRRAFVVYYSGISRRRQMGVIVQMDDDGEVYYSVYTDSFYCEVKNGEFKTAPIDHYYGSVPVIEYQANIARLGAFEVVLSILDQINMLESNRADSIQDFVNAYDVFQNCEVDEDTYKELSQGGRAINVKTVVQGMEAKVYRVASELDQTGVQTNIDDLTEKYLTICGMPNRNGGSSTSDTGQATIYRDGWAEAESRAKDTETMWKRSEREFLRLVLRICDANEDPDLRLDLKLSDIRPEFTRKNYAGLQTKVQVLCQMLSNEHVHPKIAWETSGVEADSERAYLLSEQYYQEQKEKALETQAQIFGEESQAGPDDDATNEQQMGDDLE